jgi:2'-hydroxyisoflavone reductase
MKKLLILGGTRFLGRHLAQQALAAGWQLTLLHRGQSGPGLFPQAEHLLADRDRDGALRVLGNGPQGGHWDAVIDTSAYVPRQVRAAAQALQGRVGHYQLVSSISVYASLGPDGVDETGALATLDDPKVEAINGQTYGGLKVLCEQAAHQSLGPRCLVTRPGLIVGPHDPTGRFSWWVQRLQRGGEVLAPGDPSTPVQFIDVRDLAAWMLLQAERGTTGVFNLTGPNTPLTMGGLLEEARHVLNPGATLTWVDEPWLLDAGVQPWTDLPVWLPRAQAGLHRTHTGRAQATGLQCRPLACTLRDTAAWLADAGAGVGAGAGAGAAAGAPVPAGALPRPPVGLAPEREAGLLKAWGLHVKGRR